MRKIDEIIIHCAATPEHKPFTTADITRWHNERGFRTIGYHYVILLDGIVEQGRPVKEVGAHCLGHNSNSIGICYIGGVDKNNKPKDTRTPAQRKALISLCKQLLAKYPHIKKISGHNQYANKACPSFDVRKDELGQLLGSGHNERAT